MLLGRVVVLGITVDAQRVEIWDVAVKYDGAIVGPTLAASIFFPDRYLT